MCGHLFVFCNAARNRLRLMWWHNGGFYIATKGMHKGGGFEFPRTPNVISKMTLLKRASVFATALTSRVRR